MSSTFSLPLRRTPSNGRKPLLLAFFSSLNRTVSPAKLYQSAFPLYHWYMVAAVCAFFAIFHFGSLLFHRQRRIAAIKVRSLAPVSEKDDFAVKPTRTPSRGVLAAPLAMKAALWKTLIWREFAVSMWASSSSELFWSVGYTVAMLVFGFIYREFSLDLYTPRYWALILLALPLPLFCTLQSRWVLPILPRLKLPCEHFTFLLFNLDWS